MLFFRPTIYEITLPGQGMLEGFSAGLYYSFYLQRNLKEVIEKYLLEIDETLILILDLHKREFTKGEINFPVVDLEDIDLEWGLRNY